MAYDPREKPLAEGLYAERAGKTTRIVADLAARDAIATADRYDGLLVQVLTNRKIYSWNAADATWDVVTGGSGIAKFATLADLEAATEMTDGDFAVTLDTNKLYQYVDSTWEEFTSGSASAVAVIVTSDDYTAVDGDKVIALAANTVTLTTTPNAVVTVKNGGESVVTVVANSGTIDGSDFHKIMNQYDSTDYMCDGVNWWAI